MNPITPNLEPKPSTQPRKAVTGGSRNGSSRFTAANVVVVAAIMLMVWFSNTALGAVGPGANALLAAEVEAKLNLSPAQRQQIQVIAGATAKKFSDTQTTKRGQPGLKAELERIRQAGQDEAVVLLTPAQKNIWAELAGLNPEATPTIAATKAAPSRDDETAARSLIIPTIQQLKNPPSRSAYGPTASIQKTRPHPPHGDRYVVLTDHTDAQAIAALKRLAEFRHGTIVTTPSLGDLYKSPNEFARLQQELRKLAPRFVAIAPRAESYRENMHLCLLKLLSSLDDEPGLDVFPGYLIAGDPAKLGELVGRTIAFKPMTRDQISPVSIGTIEDDGVTRYRSYQKAKVLQKMFAEQGKDSPAVFIVTNPSLAAREDFPKLGANAGEIAMMPTRPRETFGSLSEPAMQAMKGRNVLFMFGHGTPGRLCGTKVSAFAPLDFSNELVFCGSCMSASPIHADRVNLENQVATKRFGSQAVENGAVMVLGHMGLCNGFPEVYPMAEHVFEGLPVGEAYQRVMNALIGNKAITDYYAQPAPRQNNPNDPANSLLLILWADPALVPVRMN